MRYKPTTFLGRRPLGPIQVASSLAARTKVCGRSLRTSTDPVTVTTRLHLSCVSRSAVHRGRAELHQATLIRCSGAFAPSLSGGIHYHGIRPFVGPMTHFPKFDGLVERPSPGWPLTRPTKPDKTLKIGKSRPVAQAKRSPRRSQGGHSGLPGHVSRSRAPGPIRRRTMLQDLRSAR